MKAIVLQEPGRFETENTEIDFKVEPDEALLKVHRVGICGTDLQAYAGEQPFLSSPRILGHELGVEVVEAGAEGENAEVGGRWSMEPTPEHPEDSAVRGGQ